ncbi:MAG: tyrosine-type recombinase/integrase [Candidatus Methylumidiphilus sp.]
MKQARVPNDSEIKRLLGAVALTKHAGRNRVAVALSYYSGLRVGEIAGLIWSDVVDRDGQVREAIQLRAETTKTGESRAVFVSERLKKELVQYVRSFKARTDQESPFLLTQKKTAFSANTLCQLFGQLYETAGMDQCSSHSGRRWFITKLAHSGISPKVIMALAGHKSLQTTQRYIEVNDELMRRAVEVL